MKHHTNDWSSPQVENPPALLDLNKETMMKDEKLRIMKLIKEGKITPEEGLELLEALGTQPAIQDEFESCSDSDDETATGKRKARWLFIKVHEKDGNKNVNIKVPITLAK
ncbi:MAG TPA: hypothetical protein ENN67_05085, partial [Firmicutes bacterium]|nr:hypothetical protein [Bacillota bacterium]